MSIVPPPKFFSIQSVAFPGYNLTQRGTQLVLSASNNDNPFQLWYRDDSWEVIQGAFVFINHGSKTALKTTRSGGKAILGPYDPAVEDNTLLWNQYNHASKNEMKLSPILSNDNALALGVATSTTRPSPDGTPAIVSCLASGNLSWKFVTFVPESYKLQCSWVTQNLTYKTPHTDVTYFAAVKHNDENSVVAFHYNNDTGDNMLWYRIPAGGQEDTTSYTSFIVVNKETGLALKGSTKPGDKVIVEVYDPMNYDFVWSEDRNQRSLQEYVSINLSKAGSTNLHWTLPTDDQYQNSAWYHPLTLLPGTAAGGFLDRQLWKFILVK